MQNMLTRLHISIWSPCNFPIDQVVSWAINWITSSLVRGYQPRRCDNLNSGSRFTAMPWDSSIAIPQPTIHSDFYKGKKFSCICVHINKHIYIYMCVCVCKYSIDWNCSLSMSIFHCHVWIQGGNFSPDPPSPRATERSPFGGGGRFRPQLWVRGLVPLVT